MLDNSIEIDKIVGKVEELSGEILIEREKFINFLSTNIGDVILKSVVKKEISDKNGEFPIAILVLTPKYFISIEVDKGRLEYNLYLLSKISRIAKKVSFDTKRINLKIDTVNAWYKDEYLINDKETENFYSQLQEDIG